MQCVVRIAVIMLSVVLLSVIMLSVVVLSGAPTGRLLLLLTIVTLSEKIQ